ncbi:AraC family transcriptional regulator [Blautia sp. MSJ-9]|nr:AraC family transcriptional regulator [Blautia sp. MSJ-9]
MKSMKYKVLAADDEFWSRENIRSLIPWEEYSLEFLEPACDGEEVLERIPEEKPDIILTDINMPFLSGLELLQRLQNEYPNIVTIAISGYDDFDKVKGVFVSGGLDYLLKPVGKEELVKVLTKALGVLEERENAKKHDETSRIQEHKLSSFLEDSEYSALLSGKLYGQSASQTHVSSTNIFSEVATLMVKFYNIAEIAEQFDHDNLQMSWSIKSRLRELTGTDGNAIIFNNSNKMSEFLIVKTADAKELRALAENILKEFPLEEYGPVSVVLHEQTSSLDDIGTVYRELISTLVTRPFSRSHCILSCPEEKNTVEMQTIGKSAPAHMETELYHLLSTGKKSETEKLIFRTCDFKHCDDGTWSYLDVKQYAGRITGILYRYVQEKCPELTAQAEEAMDNIDYYMKCLNAPSLFASLKILLDSLWESGEDKGADSSSVVQQVEQIHRYIEQSYHENITLTALAEQYHMDASYLSRIFSQKYGETIIAFLTRIRMEKAAELMKDQDKKLETISFLVGYDDYNYFSRVFRKKMGCSPREYRNNLAQL